MNVASRSSGHWFFGLIILIIGIVFLLENIFGFQIWENVWLFWPILFLLWGLMELFQRRSIFFGIILLAIGVIFLAKNFELYQWSESIWKFWPVIIIAIGIDQLFTRSDSIPIKTAQRGQKGKKILVTQDDEII